jgi:hypothetical protein
MYGPCYRFAFLCIIPVYNLSTLPGCSCCTTLGSAGAPAVATMQALVEAKRCAEAVLNLHGRLQLRTAYLDVWGETGVASALAPLYLLHDFCAVR